MKLFYAAGTCSLSPHIVAREAGIDIDLEQVDIAKMPRRTESGADYATVNPNHYVPALELDDGSILTEGVAIVQYLADLKPSSRPRADGRHRAALSFHLVAQFHRHRVAQALQPMALPPGLRNTGAGHRARQDRHSASACRA